MLTQAVWIVIALATIGLFVAGIPAEFALLQSLCPTPECTTGQLSEVGFRVVENLGLRAGFYATYAVVLDVVFAAVYGGSPSSSSGASPKTAWHCLLL